MKKTAKKLTLSKETVRGLTDDLGKVRGATDVPTGASNCYICEWPESTYPLCVA